MKCSKKSQQNFEHHLPHYLSIQFCSCIRTHSSLSISLSVFQQELELFSPQLARKPQVVVINKADLPEVQTRLQEEKLLEKVRLLPRLLFGLLVRQLIATMPQP